MALTLLEDHRWGWTSLYWGDPKEPLLIDPAVRTCAAFLGRKSKGEEKIIATAFFLRWDEPPWSFAYLVTAAHIIEHTTSPEYSDDGIVYLYLNSRNGRRFKPIKTEIKHWYVHPTDGAVDVAVLPFKILPEWDHTALNIHPHEDVQHEPDRWRIGVGTDVFITGLFDRHRGRERNIPIVRTGTLAALPEEMIDIGESGEERLIRAYLIETHSTGGLSGSPVFANPMDLVARGAMIHLRTMHIWIGLVSAHWQFDQDKAEAEQRNSGIAIVSPRESVLEVLQHPRLVEMREKDLKQRRKETQPTMDDAQKPKRRNRDIEIPRISREKFFDELTKATRKRGKK